MGDTEAFPGDLGDAGDRSDHRCTLERHQDHLLVRRPGKTADCVDVALGYEIVDRLNAAATDRIGDKGCRLGFGLGLPLAGLGGSEGGLAPSFGGENQPLAFRPRP